MHTITPARLRPGITLDDLPVAQPAGSVSGAEPIVRGRALIFWDPKLAGTKFGRKLDAIDTDQITPAADCVSESLETLDERWKAGAFRYLMPDFRARVHRGETFVIAGDRFAIGSSREMSPAGLKAIAEEVGLELVVVCGQNMGDIFRRNALNLGLHVVQSPEAVADARDGDEFEFEPASRRLRNVTQGRTYVPLPLTPKEDEIRRSGGIFAAGRRELRALRRTRAVDRVARRRACTDDDDHRADPLGASRGQGRDGHAGRDAARRSRTCCRRRTARRRSRSTPSTRSPAARPSIPRQAAIANDHFVFTGRDDDEKQTGDRARRSPRSTGSSAPYYATPGDGIFHFYFPEQGLVYPGQFIPGADSHSRAYGAYGAVGIGVGSTTLGFGWATGYVYVTLARAAPRRVHRALQPWVSGKDIVLELLRRWGSEAGAGHVGRARGSGRAAPDAVSQHDRQHDGRSGGDERHLRAGRGHDGVVPRHGHRGAPVSRWSRPGETRATRSTRRSRSTTIAPMIAKPFSPGNAFAAEEVARERLTFTRR